MSTTTISIAPVTQEAGGTVGGVPIPSLGGVPYLTDGGLETTLVFHAGIDLPDFAAFPLVDDPDGRRALEGYYAPYLDVAARDRRPMVLDTPTWRANADWGPRLGYDAERLADVNVRTVELVRDVAARRPEVPVVINGVIGPRGDGYVAGEAMSVGEASGYHGLQARAFARAGVDMITAVTMTNVPEAIGVVRAATDAGLPVVIGFTVETDGRLPSGDALGAAIEAVDAATERAPAYFMVNCAHPSHFEDTFLGGGDWVGRIGAIRANASRASHAELDEAEELDRGDPAELAEDYARLRTLLPGLVVVGGCCGTDHDHVARISARVWGD